uniref:Uncharacterized protein n=1 Tax=Oryza rufipogon TaxID=4529 RepID=A0A0E0P4L1_ORYRU
MTSSLMPRFYLPSSRLPHAITNLHDHVPAWPYPRCCPASQGHESAFRSKPSKATVNGAHRMGTVKGPPGRKLPGITLACEVVLRKVYVRPPLKEWRSANLKIAANKGWPKMRYPRAPVHREMIINGHIYPVLKVAKWMQKYPSDSETSSPDLRSRYDFSSQFVGLSVIVTFQTPKRMLRQGKLVLPAKQSWSMNALWQVM